MVSKEEMAHANDLGDYYCIPADTRDLNYDQYFTQGRESLDKIEEYHSHNTKQLDVDGTIELLMRLDEIREDVNSEE